MRPVLLLLICMCLPAAAQKPALAITNARVWTADPDRPWASAVAITGNRITAVGTAEEIARLSAADTIDAGGKLLIPGFNDAHIHFASGAQRLFQVDLTGACTLAEMQGRIAKWAKANPDAAWITGGGWEYNCFPGARLPMAADLDPVSGDRPAYIRAYDGHTSWANSKAMRIAGVTKDTTWPGFGEVVKDPASGLPTGAFKEGASSLIAKHVPPPTREHRLRALRRGLELAASLGITSLQNASGSREELEIYDELLKSGALTARVSLAMSMSEDAGFCSKIGELRDKYRGPQLRVQAVKFMLDGVIESHTAVMLDNYSDGSNTRGTPAWDPAVYRKAVKACHDAGFQIYTHALGDGAVRMALDAYESLQDKGARARIEHIEVIHPDDLRRFQELGVLASMQPIHPYPSTIGVWSKAVGPGRSPYAFAWRSLEKGGATLVFSSDWPSSLSLNPLMGIHTAVNRQTLEGRPKGGWIPEQRLSLESALRAYTAAGAYASFEEKTKGMIREGHLADLALLDRNLFEIKPLEIGQSKVVLTVFDGRVVYRRR